MSDVKPRMPKRATAEVYVCVDPALADELARQQAAAEERVDAEAEGPPRRLADSPAKPPDRDELAARQAEAFETLQLQALPRDEWQALLDAHPPRDGNADDRLARVNTGTFFIEAVPASIVEPDASRTFWDEWLGSLSHGEWRHLCQEVNDLNRVFVNSPLSPTVSLRTPTSGGG